MKKLLALFTCFLLISSIRGQETVVLTTDRDIYIGGESMWLKITNITTSTNQISPVSKLAYIELLNRNNEPVIQEKVYFNNGVASTQILIPDTISTDNYMLRAYTQWMTNASAHNYAQDIISVINPFAGNSLPNIAEKKVVKQSDNESLKLDLKGLQSAYEKRQRVTMALCFEDLNWNHYSVSVVKSCLYKPENNNDANIVNSKLSLEHTKMPEHKGELITGTITSFDSGEPVVDEKMMISFVGPNPIIDFSLTDSLGQFAFEVNRFGQQEMVIQPYSTDTTKLNYKINLEEKYSSDFRHSEIPDLLLDSLSVKEINRAIINMQINTIYSSHLPESVKADSIENIESFYGIPENQIVIDKYIELATMEEVIREIVPFVSLRKTKGEYSVKVYEEKSLYPRDGKVMTFVDGVPINDVDRILNISPEYMEKIEVINLNYYYKDENLGRLVMFYTWNGDMGNMDFDKRIFRQVHQGYLLNHTFISPDYSNEELLHSRLADYRNVLFFGSFEKNKNEGQESIEFYTGDDAGEYVVVVTGINEMGKKEVMTKSFVVE
ncbi:hypothetical protein [Carboxylicivirga marina]|uniref:hypothetical protein n=1 Tax=Carboxylicivirga marina TaxID=2800988 RepID=UPI002592403F|nr:hypothetical protein [uncultured Carboxylicivirga sp.]